MKMANEFVFSFLQLWKPLETQDPKRYPDLLMIQEFSMAIESFQTLMKFQV